MTSGNGMRDPDALREEIRQTRAELGQTVQALAAKADVKARLKGATAQKKEQLRDQAMQKKEQLRGQAMQKKGQLRGQAMQKKEQLRGQAGHGGESMRGHLWHGSYTVRNSGREIGTLIRRHPVLAVGAGVALFTILAARRRRG
ncbi:MAG TPA: DUF3618 domain-containing protein [Micromonosporaceae bacterium]|nr:DUF3618 domain-containing protein [Micromonosporaceae bacterium]